MNYYCRQSAPNNTWHKKVIKNVWSKETLEIYLQKKQPYKIFVTYYYTIENVGKFVIDILLMTYPNSIHW